MLSNTSAELVKRNTNIKSQKKFWVFLDSDIINKLVHLFDSDNRHLNKKIYKYVEDERKMKGLDMSGVTIESEVYGHKDSNSSLYLSISKNNKEFLHLTIHLSAKSFNPKDAGLIHMFKDFYKQKNLGTSKKKLYSVIGIKECTLKPKSLKFYIGYGYITTGVINHEKYDSNLQNEINIIITVLNQLFDEDNKNLYIGDKNNLFSIHNLTNNVLKNIDNSQYVERKNKGHMMYPQLNVNKPYIIQHCMKTRIKRKSKLRITKKRNKLYSCK
jgi:hypothetical protein